MSRLRSLREDFAAGRLAKEAYIRAMHEIHTLLYEYAELLPETDIAKISVTDHAVEMTLRSSGAKLLCDRHDHRIAPIESLNFGHHEAREAAVVRRLVTPKGRLFDVGANIGVYSVSLALVFPELEVHAFEPVPTTFGWLKRNVERNGLEARVNLHTFGFSDEAGDHTMYFYPAGSGNASLRNVSARTDAEEIRCRLEVLDAFVERTGKAPDFVKCDVEGAELSVFRGARKTLATHAPVVFTEMLRKWSAPFGYHPNELIALFAEHGYRCFHAVDGEAIEAPQLSETMTMTEETTQTNFFFLHREHHASLIAGVVR